MAGHRPGHLAAPAARAIVTHNVKDLRGGELLWPDLKVLTPAECLEALK